MQLYNTLSRTVADFTPIEPGQVKLYACGLTVYDYTHIGHLRKYALDDVLVKLLRARGYQVQFVQNITDVGHLTSDGDTGEDKLEKGAKKYGKTAWKIAQEFEEYFWYSMELMGCVRPDVSCRATEHIPAQIALVETLEKKDYTYIIEHDGVYFDTSKFANYGQLARLNTTSESTQARVEIVEGKRQPADFALWKFERLGENRQMSWDSPWAKRGFPGWHIECSAMAMQYLGPQLDIHTGGVDHIPVHHTNEIAQAEAATGKVPFVRYWVHHNHLHVDGTKMSKSLNNFFTIDDVLAKGIHPRALRLLFLQSHYRDEQNFTWESLQAAQTAYTRLLAMASSLKTEQERTVLSAEKLAKVYEYRERFFAALENDLNTPQAVAMLGEVVKSNIPGPDKYDLLLEFDEVLGLGLRGMGKMKVKLPSLLKVAGGEETRMVEVSTRSDELMADDNRLSAEVRDLLAQRMQARATKDWAASDSIRDQLVGLGWKVRDIPGGDQTVMQVAG